MKKYILFIIVIFGITIRPNISLADDTYFSDQTYMQSIEYLTPGGGVYNYGSGKGVTIAIIDEGIWQAHPDLKGSEWLNEKEIPGNSIDDDKNGYIDDYYGWNFVDANSDMTPKGTHGTMVTGIIGAQHNDIGIAGIAPEAKIMSLIACSSSGCPTVSVQSAIKYAVDNGANIINLSLGSSGYVGFKESYDQYVKYAYDHGVLIIASAGNGDPSSLSQFGQDLDFQKASPACNDVGGANMVLAVGSLNRQGERSSWSNYSSRYVDVWAQGEDVLSTTVPQFSGAGIGYMEGDGTSFSAPIVSGIAALIKSKNQGLSNTQIIDIIKGAWKLNLPAIWNQQSNWQYFKSSAIGNGGGGGTIMVTNATQKQTPFTDISPESTFFDATNYLKEANIIQGYSDGTYRPYNRINRAEFAKIVIEALDPNATGSNCFSDVQDQWYAKYVCLAKNSGIINGYSDGSFRPDQNINLVEALKITLLGFKVALSNNVGTHWYDVYFNTASEKQILGSIDSDLSHSLNRGEMAQIIYRLKYKK